MKKLILLAALSTVLSAHTCNKKTVEATGSSNAAEGVKKIGSIMGTKWVLQTLKGNAVSMPDGVAAPWLKLAEGGTSIEGSGGCNALIGSFDLQGDKISFPGLGATKKYCEALMPTESAFIGALKKVDQFKMDGPLLKLMSDGAELASFKAE